MLTALTICSVISIGRPRSALARSVDRPDPIPSPTQLRYIAHDVAREVRALLPAGWKLDPSEVRIEVLSRRELSAAQRRMQREAGLEPRGLLGRLAQHVARSLLGQTYAAFYAPQDHTLYLPRDQVARSSREQLRALLAHELTHAAQHQSHPETFEAMSLGHSRSLKEARTAEQRRRISARAIGDRMLIEGQAMVVGQAFGGAENGPRPKARQVFAQLALLVGSHDFRQLLLAYPIGKELVRQMPRPMLEMLWRSDELRDEVLGPVTAKLREATALGSIASRLFEGLRGRMFGRRGGARTKETQTPQLDPVTGRSHAIAKVLEPASASPLRRTAPTASARRRTREPRLLLGRPRGARLLVLPGAAAGGEGYAVRAQMSKRSPALRWRNSAD